MMRFEELVTLLLHNVPEQAVMPLVSSADRCLYVARVEFLTLFQLCSRCTAFAAAARAHCGAREGPVVVRTEPVEYEGVAVRACKHFGWVWCQGGRGPKCLGNHRYSPCPKYIAASTAWKHGYHRRTDGPATGTKQ